MRVLLDECLPRKLKKELSNHEVVTVPEMGWASIKNGNLLRLAEASFDIFITVDRNLEYQQNLGNYDIKVIVLVTRDIRFRALLPLMPGVLEAVETIGHQDLIHVSRPSPDRK